MESLKIKTINNKKNMKDKLKVFGVDLLQEVKLTE